MTPPPPSAAAAAPDPEYVAIILAATQGARLYPLTSEYSSGGTPKHLLPTSVLNDAVGRVGGDGASCPLVRLLVRAAGCGQFGSVAVAVNAEDGMTSARLVECGACRAAGDGEVAAYAATGRPSSGDEGGRTTDLIFGEEKKDGTGGMHVRVVRLPDDCHGSADALRHLSRNRHVPRSSNAVVMPGDLILEGQLLRGGGGGGAGGGGRDVLSDLVDSHRRWNAGGPSCPGSAVTMILTDVGAEDRDGAPLKESSKAKLGLLSREEEDMDYVGLSSETAPPLSGSLRHHAGGGPPGDGGARRVVMKRSKLEVEEDEGTGATPKVVLAKRRMHAAGSDRRGGGRSCASSAVGPDRSPSVTIRTDLHDVHLYALSNWVFDLIHARPSMQSLQNEVVPLLISRQYRGVEGAFGATSWRRDDGNRERLRRVLRGMDRGADPTASDRAKVANLLGMYASGVGRGAGHGGLAAHGENGDPNDHGGTGEDGMDGTASVLGAPPPFPGTRHGYAVAARVLSREASRLALRACTHPSLLHGCGAVTSAALGLGPADAAGAVADGARLSSKFGSVLLSGCRVGERVQTKACTVGRNVVLGDRSRLNNVVVMDGATVGTNTVLQNSIVGPGATVGDNCNLKDCQVGPGADVPSGTRTAERGETFEA